MPAARDLEGAGPTASLREDAGPISLLEIADRVVSLDTGRTRLGAAAEVLLEVGETLAARLDVTQILEQLASLAMRATEADRCGIFIRNDESDSCLVPLVGAVRSGDRTRLAAQFRGSDPLDLEVERELQRLIVRGTSAAVEDVPDSPFVPDAWKVWRSKSLAFSFMKVQEAAYGLIVVDWTKTAHRFSSEELRVLDAIAGAAGIALRNARLVNRLRRDVELQRRLFECGAALRTEQSLEEMCAPVVDGFVSLLSLSACTIYLVDASVERLSPVVWRGFEGPPPEIAVGGLPGDQVARVRRIWEADPFRPLVLSRSDAAPAWRDIFPAGTDAALFVPLTDGSRIVGVVAAGRSASVFDEEELSVARAFADLASAAVGRAKLTELLAARLRVVEAMQRLGELVGGTSGGRSLLSTLDESICGEVGMSCVSLSLQDPFMREIFRLPQPSRSDVDLLRSWRSLPAGTRPSDIEWRENDQIAVPVPVQNRIAGVFRVDAPRLRGPEELELVHAIAAAIGEVAAKARLRRIADRRTQELVVAEERERIARDLHDTVGQTLYGMGLELQDMIQDVSDPDVAARLGELRALASEGVAKVRSAVYSLSFLHVRARGLVPSLRALTRQFARATGVAAELRVDGSLPRLSEEARGALYRMAHEALINVERHARASGVILTLRSRDDTVELTIRDDGVGLDQRQTADWQSAAHFGMRTMAKSVHEVGGRFSVVQAQPRGLLITGVVPVVDPYAGR